MAIAVLFTPASMSADAYDQIIRRLEAAGVGAPRGRLDHVCYGAGSNMRVFDIWESQEALNAFGEKLMPILQEVGVEPGQPEISAVHNTIRG